MQLVMLQFRMRLQKCIRMGITIFKISFGEVYCRIYVRKSRSRITIKLISNDIPPQMKILNTVIP